MKLYEAFFARQKFIHIKLVNQNPSHGTLIEKIKLFAEKLSVQN